MMHFKRIMPKKSRIISGTGFLFEVNEMVTPRL